MFGPDQRIPGSSPSRTRSLFKSTCSPVLLYWFVNDRVVCGLPVIHAPKRSLGIIRKERGLEFPGTGLAILSKVGITGSQ
jgi:hypothetical protein